MSNVTLFSVTFRPDDWTDDVSVEVFASQDAAAARCDELTRAGIYAVVAEQGIEIFQ